MRQWNTWLTTELPVVHVPRAARACFTLWGKPSLGKKELEEMPLGWARLARQKSSGLLRAHVATPG